MMISTELTLPKKRLNAVNKKAKKIAEKLNIDNKIEKIQETEVYIAVKDH